MSSPNITFGPVGLKDEPERNRIHVMLATPEGEMHFEFPAPGVLKETDGVRDLMILHILAAIEKLQKALNVNSNQLS